MNPKVTEAAVVLLQDCCTNLEATPVASGLMSGEAAQWLVRHGLAQWIEYHRYIGPTTEGRAAAALLALKKKGGRV